MSTINSLSITGVDEILTKIARMSKDVPRAVRTGMSESGLMLKRVSMKRVPVDTGNMKASAFSRMSSNTITGAITVRVGYTAAYALAVHEMIGMKLKGQDRPTGGKYWDPQGSATAKFLENPFREMYKDLVGHVYYRALNAQKRTIR